MPKTKILTILIALLLLITAYGDISGKAQIDKICVHRITFEISGHVMEIPYCRNHSLDTPNPAIKRAVIVIHGSSRTADSYYSYVERAALTAGAETESIIIAPQFLIEDDIKSFGLGDRTLFWSNSGWKRGDNSLSTNKHPRPVKTSSFSVIDMILERVTDPQRFPSLHTIVIAGHSAGGQFVNRFAAGSPLQNQITRQYNTQFRYLVANPSSYLYFNNERRIPGMLDQFQVPNSTGCSYFNEYKYGLEDLNNYMRIVGAAEIRNQYQAREVAYLLGSEDNDPDANLLDKTCPAMFQGLHRLERGIIYHNFIKHYFGQAIGNHHFKAIIPGVGHSAFSIFNSACGIRFLFDYNPSSVDCGEPPRPRLIINFRNGAPGSFFLLSGEDFPENSVINLMINSLVIGEVNTDTSGKFSFTVSTDGADPGLYFVTAKSGDVRAITSFRLGTSEPYRPYQNVGPIYEVPSGIALTRSTFLPLAWR